MGPFLKSSGFSKEKLRLAFINTVEIDEYLGDNLGYTHPNQEQYQMKV